MTPLSLTFGMTPQERYNVLEDQVTKITLNRKGGKPFMEAIEEVTVDVAKDRFEKRMEKSGEDSPQMKDNDWFKASDLVMNAYKKIRCSIIGRSNWQMPKEGGKYYNKEEKQELKKDALEMLA